jgi:hypothetical protein
MKTLALIALTTLLTLSAVLPSQAGNNPFYPQDRSWDLTDQGPNGGGGGGGGGGE